MQRMPLPWLQHISNPLHVYCRLLDLGFSTRISRRLGQFYEKCLHLFLLGSTKR